MKRIALTLLASSFALTQFAAAQDQDQPAPVTRPGAAARRQAEAPRASAPAAQQQRAAQNASRPVGLAPQRFQGTAPQMRGNVGNQPRFNGAGPRIPNRTGAIRPTVPTPSANGGVNVPSATQLAIDGTGPGSVNAGGRTRGDWRSGVRRDGSPRFGNRDTAAAADPNVSATASDAVNQDWRNRTGRTSDGRSRTGTNGEQNWTGGGRNGNRDWRNRTGGDRNWDHHRGDGNWNHDRSHHDRNWWRSRYSRFSRFGGGYYYLDAGFWYPAYGYDPYYSTYVYDAPIYSYNDLSPEQVMSNVQAELARRGYYYGSIDGTYGPQTREAILRYQEENGLAVTGTVDQPTLESLGFE